jgi:hypothetical protein
MLWVTSDGRHGTNQEEGAAIMKIKYTNRKPDTLFLLALIVSLGVFMSTGATAAETLFGKASFSRMMDGDMKLAQVGAQGAGLHMTFKSPSRENEALYVSQADNYSSKDHGVHLSVQMPW